MPFPGSNRNHNLSQGKSHLPWYGNNGEATAHGNALKSDEYFRGGGASV